MTTSLLTHWGMDGYIRWLRGIKATYNMRKTWMCDTFDDVFHLEFDNGKNNNVNVLEFGQGLGKAVTCYAKNSIGSAESRWDEKRGLTSSKRGPPLVSFIPPTGT